MGTVFVLSHLFALALIGTLFFYLIRNTCKPAQRLSDYFRYKFLWNSIVLFLMESYMEIGLCASSVVKRAQWDEDGNFNINSNIVYGYFYLFVVVFIFPVVILTIYCRKKRYLNREDFMQTYGSPYTGLKRFHRNRVIFYVFYHFVRRIVFIGYVVLDEESFYGKIMTLLILTEIALVFILSQKPFYEPFRNNMEIFNEMLISLMIIFCLCFSGIMEPEAVLTIGLIQIFLIAVYVLVHFSSLISDTVKKIFLYIWLKLSQCKCGRSLQRNLKKRYLRI